MSLCYDFQKWTMITFSLVAGTLVTGYDNYGRLSCQAFLAS
jgi:hypothetical protein